MAASALGDDCGAGADQALEREVRELRQAMSGDMEIWTRDDMRNWTPS
jgi:hypothetical protein